MWILSNQGGLNTPLLKRKNIHIPSVPVNSMKIQLVRRLGCIRKTIVPMKA
jgi:hypothetical protein